MLISFVAHESIGFKSFSNFRLKIFETTFLGAKSSLDLILWKRPKRVFLSRMKSVQLRVRFDFVQVLGVCTLAQHIPLSSSDVPMRGLNKERMKIVWTIFRNNVKEYQMFQRESPLETWVNQSRM